MAFLILGLALLALKWLELGPVAQWEWWVVLAPFGCAVLWWSFVDATGLTQKRAMDKMEKRKADRRERALENLGMGQRDKQRPRVLREGARQLETDSAASTNSRSKSEDR